MDNAILLKIEHLSAGYGAIQVLWDINIELRFNEIVCIVGANGAGKTTLLNTILGSVPLWREPLTSWAKTSAENLHRNASKWASGLRPRGGTSSTD